MRVVLLVVLMLSLGLAGCSGGATPPQSMYPDLSHRYSDVTTEAFEHSHRLELPAGPHTVFVSVEGEEDFGVRLTEPGQREPYSGVMMPGASHHISHQGIVDIDDLRFTTRGSGPAGTWTLAVGCNGPCAYTVGVEEGAAIPDGLRPPSSRKDTSVSGMLEADSTSRTMPVSGSGVPMIAYDVYGLGGMDFRIEDAAGDRVSSWTFADIYARGWRYEALVEDTAAGEWNVDVSCGGRCHFHIGVV